MIDNARARILKHGSTYTVEVPSLKHIVIQIFAPIWLIGWATGEYFVINMLIDTPRHLVISIFIIVWLVVWSFGGLITIFPTLWVFFGKEKISFVGHRVKLEKTVFGLGTRKILERQYIKEFMFEKLVVKTSRNSRNNSWIVWGLGDGKIKFECHQKTYYFGLSLSDEEAKIIIETLNKKLINR